MSSTDTDPHKTWREDIRRIALTCCTVEELEDRFNAPHGRGIVVLMEVPPSEGEGVTLATGECYAVDLTFGEDPIHI